MKVEENKFYELSICENNGYYCITLNDYRIAGTLYCGITHVVKEYSVDIETLAEAIPEIKSMLKETNKLKDLMTKHKIESIEELDKILSKIN